MPKDHGSVGAALQISTSPRDVRPPTPKVWPNFTKRSSIASFSGNPCSLRMEDFSQGRLPPSCVWQGGFVPVFLTQAAPRQRTLAIQMRYRHANRTPGLLAGSTGISSSAAMANDRLAKRTKCPCFRDIVVSNVREKWCPGEASNSYILGCRGAPENSHNIEK